MKNAFYFDHDYSARNDMKILELRYKYGWEGYGLFWAIVETLCEQNGHIKREALGGLSLGLSIDKVYLTELIDHCVEIGLLNENENSLSNTRSLKHLELRKRLSDYGKKGGRPKLQNELKPTLTPPLTPLKAGEERKGKKRKEKVIIKERNDEYFLNDLGWDNDLETYQAIKKLFSKLLQMKVPLSFEQHTGLVKKWTSPKVRDIYSEMQNYSKLLINNDEAAKTADNWLRRNAENYKKNTTKGKESTAEYLARIAAGVH